MFEISSSFPLSFSHVNMIYLSSQKISGKWFLNDFTKMFTIFRFFFLPSLFSFILFSLFLFLCVFSWLDVCKK